MIQERLRDEYPDLDVNIRERDGLIILKKVVVPKNKRGDGVGSDFMTDLVEYADDTQKTISLTPSTDFGASSKSRLKRFYKQFGFVENSGRNKDYRISESMYREPAPELNAPLCDGGSSSANGCFNVPDLEKLPKGSNCEGKQDVPARSDYWRDDTDSVERCSSFNTGGGGGGNGDDGPYDPPDDVAGWTLKRDLDDQIDYSAEWYSGLDTAEFATDTEPWEVAEVILTITETGSNKYPNRWTVRVIHWNEDDENVSDTDIESYWGDSATENRNNALGAAIAWMQSYPAKENPHDEPTDDEDESEDEAEDDTLENPPSFEWEGDNGRLREVTEPWYRFGGTKMGKGNLFLTVDGTGALDMRGVNGDNHVMYETSLILGSGESASVDNEGQMVAIDGDGLAAAINDVNMSEPAKLYTKGDTLVYEGAGRESEFTMHADTTGHPSMPGLNVGVTVENIPANRFDHRMKGIQKIDDTTLAFVVEPDEAYLVVEDNNTEERARAQLTDDAGDITYNVDADRYASPFSIPFMDEIRKSPYAPKSTDLRFEMYELDDPEYEKYNVVPINVRYEQRGGPVRYMVAPRIPEGGNKGVDVTDWDLSAPLEAVEYEGTCPFGTGEFELHEPIEPGEPVPDAVADHMETSGDTIIWTFPNSDGCRCGTQAKNYDTLASEYGVNVYGIADSDPEDLQDMASTLGLEAITLVSDQEGTFTEPLGIERTNAGYERKTLFVRDGRIKDVSDGVLDANLAQPFHPDDENESADGCLTPASDDAGGGGACPFDRYPDVDLDTSDEWTLAEAASAEGIKAPKHPGIYVITGQRGAGKSALAMQVGEKMKNEHGVQPVTVGMPVQAREHFPDDWMHVRHVHDAPGDSVLIVDEAYMSYHSRESMSEENKNLGKLINTSRHCGNSMLFVSQNSSYIEKNTVSEADAILAKEPGKMQMQFERMQIRSISKEAKEQFNALPEDVDNRAYVYMYGDEHTGMLQNDMPEWYNEEISKSFRALCKNREDENETEGEAEGEETDDEATEKAQQAAENAL